MGFVDTLTRRDLMAEVYGHKYTLGRYLYLDQFSGLSSTSAVHESNMVQYTSKMLITLSLLKRIAISSLNYKH